MKLKYLSHFQKLSIGFVLCGVIGFGVYIITTSYAATPYVSSETESGLLTGAASVQSSSTVSGGKYVQFGTSNTVYGVLQANTSYLQTDTAAGVRLAEVEVNWGDWEPSSGSYNQSYINSIIAQVNSYASAGWQVAISIGLQYPPNWVLQLPNGQLTDQNGNHSGTPNYEFNQAVRSAASSYMNNVITALKPYPVSYYRVGLSNTGEMAIGPIVNNNSWWAFDPIAQGTASGLPAGLSASPLPGWIPGTPTYNGVPITQAQVQSWYNWYLGAVENAESWEITTYRSAGYEGKLELVMPGDGATPSLYAERIADNLASENFDGYATMNTGTAYQLVLNNIPLQNTVVDISSVQDDGSSISASQCQASDSSLALSAADPWKTGWSSVRWLTYLADQHNLTVMGENPGSNSSTDMTNTFTLVKSCQLSALQWAFDYQLYNGTNATIQNYAALIGASQS